MRVLLACEESQRVCLGYGRAVGMKGDMSEMNDNEWNRLKRRYEDYCRAYFADFDDYYRIALEVIEDIVRYDLNDDDYFKELVHIYRKYM